MKFREPQAPYVEARERVQRAIEENPGATARQVAEIAAVPHQFVRDFKRGRSGNLNAG